MLKRNNSKGEDSSGAIKTRKGRSKSVIEAKSAGDVGRKTAGIKRKAKKEDESPADVDEDTAKVVFVTPNTTTQPSATSSAATNGTSQKKKVGSERGRWRLSLEPRNVLGLDFGHEGSKDHEENEEDKKGKKAKKEKKHKKEKKPAEKKKEEKHVDKEHEERERKEKEEREKKEKEDKEREERERKEKEEKDKEETALRQLRTETLAKVGMAMKLKDEALIKQSEMKRRADERHRKEREEREKKEKEEKEAKEKAPVQEKKAALTESQKLKHEHISKEHHSLPPRPVVEPQKTEENPRCEPVVQKAVNEGPSEEKREGKENAVSESVESVAAPVEPPCQPQEISVEVKNEILAEERGGKEEKPTGNVEEPLELKEIQHKEEPKEKVPEEVTPIVPPEQIPSEVRESEGPQPVAIEQTVPLEAVATATTPAAVESEVVGTEEKNDAPQDEKAAPQEPSVDCKVETIEATSTTQNDAPSTGDATATTEPPVAPPAPPANEETNRSVRLLLVEEKKKQLLALHQFDGHSAIPRRHINPLSESGPAGANSKPHEPITLGNLGSSKPGRKRRNTLDDMASPPSHKLSSKMSPFIAHLALPFLPQHTKALDDMMVPLTPISELSPTTEQAFRREKQLRRLLEEKELAIKKMEQPPPERKKKRTSIVASIHTGPVLQALADANFTDQNIWEGTPKLFSLLREYKDVLHAVGESSNVVNFIFPDLPEFNAIKSKTYKIKNNQPINKLVASILKRVVVGKSVSRRFGLCTLGGYFLDDKEALISYGLGSLLESWELKIMEKQARPARAVPLPPTPAALPRVPTEERNRPDNSKKLERRVQNSEVQQTELESKMTALSLRLEQQLEERDRKIAELVNHLKEKEEAASRAQDEMKELISEREASIRLEVTNNLMVHSEKNVEEKLRDVIEELDGVKRKSSEEKERQEELVKKLKDELERGKEELKELARQNKELKIEVDGLPKQVQTVFGSRIIPGSKPGPKKEGENSISFDKFDSELTAVRREFEEKQQSMLEKILERFDSEKKELKAIFRENEKRLKEDNENLRKLLEERERQMKEQKKELTKAQQRIEEMVMKVERRLDEEIRAEFVRVSNSVTELKLSIDNDRNDHNKRLSILTENVDNLAETIAAVQNENSESEERYQQLASHLNAGSDHVQHEPQAQQQPQLPGSLILPPPPPTAPVYQKPVSYRGDQKEEEDEEQTAERIGAESAKMIEEIQAALTLEEQILSVSLRRRAEDLSCSSSSSESIRRRFGGPALGDHASLLFSGLQKRFSNIQTIEKIEELEDLSEDEDDDDEF